MVYYSSFGGYLERFFINVKVLVDEFFELLVHSVLGGFFILVISSFYVRKLYREGYTENSLYIVGWSSGILGIVAGIGIIIGNLLGEL